MSSETSVLRHCSAMHTAFSPHSLLSPMASVNHSQVQNGHRDSTANSPVDATAHDEHAQLRSSTEQDDSRSLTLRAWHALLSPFSATALAGLPRLKRPERYLRADDIPVTEANEDGQRPTVRDYHSITSLPPNVHVPKKIPTSIKVEGKVWFANERTWISWLNISILLATLSLGLFNASKDDVARNFAYVYALISVCVLVYGYTLYQHRISMIRRRDPGHFDVLAGPVILSVALSIAVLANFVIRVRELQKKEIPIPDLFRIFWSPQATYAFQQ